MQEVLDLSASRGEEEDIFIPESQVHGAFHMDTVQVAVTSENSGKRREGTITKIISRGTTRIVCTYEKSKTFGFAGAGQS